MRNHQNQPPNHQAPNQTAGLQAEFLGFRPFCLTHELFLFFFFLVFPWEANKESTSETTSRPIRAVPHWPYVGRMCAWSCTTPRRQGPRPSRRPCLGVVFCFFQSRYHSFLSTRTRLTPKVPKNSSTTHTKPTPNPPNTRTASFGLAGCVLASFVSGLFFLVSLYVGYKCTCGKLKGPGNLCLFFLLARQLTGTNKRIRKCHSQHVCPCQPASEMYHPAGRLPPSSSAHI